MIESLRVLMACRKTAVTAKRVALQLIHNTIVCAPDGLRDQLRKMTRMQLIRPLASWRPDCVGGHFDRFGESMSNRLNDMVRSAIIVVMQRLHDDDVSGDILTREASYCHLMIPMEFDSSRYPVSSDSSQVLYEGNDLGWVDPRALDDEGNGQVDARPGSDPKQN
jgi:hypothetical protein